MASKTEFIAAFERIRVANDKILCKVNAIKAQQEKKTKIQRLCKECLKMMEDVFEMPIRMPANAEEVAEQWTQLILMIERLSMLKEDIQQRLKAAAAGEEKNFLKGALLSSAVFAAGSAVLGFMAPGVAGWLVRRFGSTAVSVGRYVAPHGISLLQKRIKYAPSSNDNKLAISQIKIDDAVAIAAGAVGAFNTVKSVVQQLRLLKANANNSA